MRTLYIILALSISSNVLYAQDTTMIDYKATGQQLDGYPISYKKSGFLLEHFTLGMLVTTEGTRIANVKMNYDIMRDELIAIQANGQFVNLYKARLQAFYVYDGVTNKDYYFNSLTYNGRKIFAEASFSCDRVTLFKKHQRKVREASPSYGYGNQSTAWIADNLFFVRLEGELFALDNSLQQNEDFQKIAGIDPNALKKILKKNTSEPEMRDLINGLCEQSAGSE